MNGAGNSGMGSLFVSKRRCLLPQGLGGTSPTAVAARPRRRRSHPNQCQLNDVESRTPETSFAEALVSPCDAKLINITDHHGNVARSLCSAVLG